jgi:hypothetical protein
MVPGVFDNRLTTGDAVPVFISYSMLTSAASLPPQDEFGSAHAHASLVFSVDGKPVKTFDLSSTTPSPSGNQGTQSCVLGSTICPQLQLSNSEYLHLELTPGLHSLLVEARVDGFASAGTFLPPIPPPLAPIPEPMTLLLFGTTAAGLGLARWRRRGRERGHAA